MKKLGVEIRKGLMVTEIDANGVTYKKGDEVGRFSAKTVLWAGGVTMTTFGRKLAERTHAETDRSGRIKVNPDLTVPKYPNIFITGDLANVAGKDGKPLPGVAQVAIQGGAYAAKSNPEALAGRNERQTVRIFRQRRHGGDRPSVSRGEYFWTSCFRSAGVADLAVYPLDVHRRISKSCVGVHSMGI